MITPSLPTNFANVVAPFSPVGKLAVGEENTEARNTPFKPVEELAESGRQENRTSSPERDTQTGEAVRLNTGARDSEDGGRDRSDSGERAGREPRQEEDAREQQEQKDRELIDELAARDREVRSHEQAHSAVGGALAGAPSYRYQRGPDGISYAISGEVPISSGHVPGDPEATLRNAQVVQRAALAPAEPSPQDRRVAAEAAQLERQALQEIAAQAQLERERAAAEVEAEREADSIREAEEQRQLQEAREQQDAVSEQEQQQNQQQAEEFAQFSIDLNRRLIGIGAIEAPNPVGGLLNLSA